MYEDNTTDAEGGLEVNIEDNEDPTMATRLDHEVPTSEVNNNSVNVSVMFPGGNSYARGKVMGRKRDSDGKPLGRKITTPYMTKENIVLILIMGKSVN